MRLLEDRLELEALFSFRESARATTTRPSGERCGQSALERRVCGLCRQRLSPVKVWMDAWVCECVFSLSTLFVCYFLRDERGIFARPWILPTLTWPLPFFFFFFVNMNFGWRDFMQTQYVVILPVFSQINMNFDFFTVVGIFLLCSEISIHYTSF